MKYILKNLYVMKKDQPIFLTLIIISVLMTSIMINFSFGTYQIFREKKLSEIDKLRHLDIAIDEDAGIVKASLDQCFQQFSGDLENLINMVLVNVKVDDNLSLECRFSVKNGKYSPSSIFRDNVIKGNLTDNYFTSEQESNGELVALIGSQQEGGQDGTLIIQNKSYQIIGRQSWDFDKPIVPFESLNPGTEIIADAGIYLSFSKALSKKQYDEIKLIFDRNFDKTIKIPRYSGEMNQNHSLYNTVMMISAGIAVIAAINYAVLFQYIMLCQEHMLAVYRMCGMIRRRAVEIYLAECLLIIMPIYVIGAIIFHCAVLPLLEKMSDTIRLVFNGKIYLLLFVVYLISSIGILSLVVAANIYRKNVANLIRRA